MMKHVLILDIGTGGIHTCLADANGNLTGNSYEEINYVYDDVTKGYELDADELFRAVKRQIRAAMEKSAVVPDKVMALAVTSQRHGCVFLDENDLPLVAYPNVDGRSQSLCEDMASHGEEIFNITARWPACWFPAPRLLWTRHNQPEVHKRIAGLLMLNEYAAFLLTGNKVSEWTNAVETMLFDIHSRAWSPRMIELFAAGDVELAPIIATGETAGTLTGAIARELGLPPVPVVMAASDTQSATLGCGHILPGDAVAVNGSTTPVFVPLDRFMVDAARRVYTSPYFGGQWALEGNCTLSGIVHRKLMDQLLRLVRRLPGQEKTERASLYDLFAGADADPEGVTMHWGPVVANIGRTTRLARLSIFADGDGRDIFTSIIPAFVENLAFSIHENARQLAEIGGRPLERLILTGGGSASVRLQRAVAALNPDKEILLTSELETTSRGAAIQAWMAVGEFADLAEAYAVMRQETWTERLSAPEDKRLFERHARWRDELE